MRSLYKKLDMESDFEKKQCAFRESVKHLILAHECISPYMLEDESIEMEEMSKEMHEALEQINKATTSEELDAILNVL